MIAIKSTPSKLFKISFFTSMITETHGYKLNGSPDLELNILLSDLGDSYSNSFTLAQSSVLEVSNSIEVGKGAFPTKGLITININDSVLNTNELLGKCKFNSSEFNNYNLELVLKHEVCHILCMAFHVN